jgi:SAM-dependent methyltransferase
MDETGFYRAFEDRHRGLRDDIKNRLNVYLPFVRPLLQVYPEATAIDLGCGRGEWLEVLTSAGLKPVGVDLDRGMLQASDNSALNVVEGDAITFLTTLPDESHVVVSAFHLVEHIAFDQLRTLVSQAHRILKPGGLLIMETPNPENIVVATHKFYLDPTHQRPIPPALLSFLPEYYGFARVKVLRLQEAPELVTSEKISLGDVLAGASPDYAVVAQKAADEEITILFGDSFTKEYGLTLDSLSSRYDTRIDQRLAAVEFCVQQAKTDAQQAEKRVRQVEIRTQQLDAGIPFLIYRVAEAQAQVQQAELRATEADARATDLHNKLDAIRSELYKVHEANHYHCQLAEERHHQLQAFMNSTSWRVTAPLRLVGTAMHCLTPSALKVRTKSLLQRAVIYVGRQPKLKKAASHLLTRVPRLKSRLRSVIIGAQAPSVESKITTTIVADLTKHATQIYWELKTAIENNRKGI